MDWDSLLRRSEDAFRQPSSIEQGTGRGAIGQVIQVRLQSGQTISATCLSQCAGAVVCFRDEQGRWYARGNAPVTQREQIVQNRRRRDTPPIPGKMIFLFLDSEGFPTREKIYVGGFEAFKQVLELPTNRKYSSAQKIPVIYPSNSGWAATVFSLPESALGIFNAFGEQLTLVKRNGETKVFTDGRIAFLFPLGFGCFASGPMIPQVRLIIEVSNLLNPGEFGTGFAYGRYEPFPEFLDHFQASGTYNVNQSRVIVFEHPPRRGLIAYDYDESNQLDINYTWEGKSFFFDLATEEFIEVVGTGSYSRSDNSFFIVRVQWDEIQGWIGSPEAIFNTTEISLQGSGTAHILAEKTLPYDYSLTESRDGVTNTATANLSLNYPNPLLVNRTKTKAIYYIGSLTASTSLQPSSSTTNVSFQGEDTFFLYDSELAQTTPFFQQAGFAFYSSTRPNINPESQFQLNVFAPSAGQDWRTPFPRISETLFDDAIRARRRLQLSANVPYEAIARWREGRKYKQAKCSISLAVVPNYFETALATVQLTGPIELAGHSPDVPTDGIAIYSNSGSFYDFLCQISFISGPYSFGLSRILLTAMPTWSGDTLYVPSTPPNRPYEETENSLEKWKIEIVDGVARMRRSGWVNVFSRRMNREMEFAPRQILAAAYIGR